MSLILSDGNITDDGMPEVLLDNDGYTPYDQRPETYVVPLVFAFIFLIGVVGNGTLITIFLRHRLMRNIPNTYIFSLACADMLVILICVPVASIIYTFDSWRFGGFVCTLTEFLKDLSIGVSVFTLTALAAERYCAIVHPLWKFQSRSLAVGIAIAIWVLSFVLATPDLFRSKVVEHVMNNETNLTIAFCSPFGSKDDPFTEEYTKLSVIAKSIVYYFVPLVVISSLYMLMAHRLHSSAREMPGELAGAQSRAQVQARRKVAHMVITFSLIFFTCFAPQHVFMLWFHLHPNSHEDYNDFWHILRIVGFCLSFLNSCINPCALYFVSGLFRQHFNHYLCCSKLVLVNRLGASTAAGYAPDTNTYRSTLRRTNTYRVEGQCQRNNSQLHRHHQHQQHQQQQQLHHHHHHHHCCIGAHSRCDNGHLESPTQSMELGEHR